MTVIAVLVECAIVLVSVVLFCLTVRNYFLNLKKIKIKPVLLSLLFPCEPILYHIRSKTKCYYDKYWLFNQNI